MSYHILPNCFCSVPHSVWLYGFGAMLKWQWQAQAQASRDTRRRDDWTPTGAFGSTVVPVSHSHSSSSSSESDSDSHSESVSAWRGDTRTHNRPQESAYRVEASIAHQCSSSVVGPSRGISSCSVKRRALS